MVAEPPTGSATAGAVPKIALGHGLAPAAFVPGRCATAIQRTMHGTRELQVLSEDSTSAFALELAADGSATACRGWRDVFRNDGPEVHTEDHGSQSMHASKPRRVTEGASGSLPAVWPMTQPARAPRSPTQRASWRAAVRSRPLPALISNA
jgi:hypothetical protein